MSESELQIIVSQTARVVEGEVRHVTPFWTAFGWSLFAVLPIVAFYVAHFAQSGVPLGFIMADLPYYCANGREVFERGNGLFYPNPYDASPDAAVIYFQWLIWVYGFAIVKLGIDPALQFLAIGGVSTIGFAFLTLRIVEQILPSKRFLGLLYLLTMWGGGFFIPFTVAANLGMQEAVGKDLLRYVPFNGWWFLSWGANAFLPNEAVYHCLIAAMWLFLLRNQVWCAVFTLTLAAATHPFTGLQHLAGVGIWLTWCFVTNPSRKNLMPVLAVGGVSSLFLWYYMRYLPEFDSHTSLEKAWRQGTWTLTTRDLVLAYAPVASLAVCRLATERKWRSPQITLFAISFFATLLLAKHELWMTHHKQPIHFTRGYLWMPLWLMGLPFAQKELVRLSDNTSRIYGAVLIVVVSTIAVSDNAVWVVAEWPRHTGSESVSSIEQSEPFVLSAEQWGVVTQIAALGSIDDVVLCSDLELSFLLPTYSSVNVYLGHWANTPHYSQRKKNVSHWLQTGEQGGWLDDITIIVRPAGTLPELDTTVWKRSYSNTDYEIVLRKK